VEPLDPALAARLSQLSERLAPLARRTADFWLAHGVDATLGGFHGTLNRQGAATAPDDKGLIQEARQLWSISTWYERREASQRVLDVASQTYAFIVDSFLDPVDGGFFFKVSRDGRRVVDAKKQLFAESYAIYALATYGRVFGVDRAIALALSRFRSIDAQRHDAQFGGYDERGDPGFLAAGAEKGTNTHLHLMEAFTALYEASGDSAVRERLDEVTRLMATTLCQPSGYVHKEFKRDWTPFGTPEVSYGHDLETAWLLMEAARVLGQEADVELRSAALRMAQHSSLRGFDSALGGYFELGIVGGATTRFDKVWWVQFEALLGLWWAFELGGEEAQLDRLEATLGWIEASEDLPVGEWFAITNPNGTAAGADYKGDEWKESHHPLRSLLFTQDWIDAALARR
jgi:mannobiose 2-epimerase